MMDPISRRSAILATVIHACLVALAFMPHGCSERPTTSEVPPIPTASVPPPSPPKAMENSAPVYGNVVAVPLSAPAMNAPLPALQGGDLPSLPDAAKLISAVRQDHATGDVSRGDRGKTGAPIDLPSIPATADDLIARLQRSAVSNEVLTREQRMLATAQEFLHGRLQSQIERNWRHLLRDVVETRLVIELGVDRRGRLTYANLVNSSGSLALDRLIGEWLRSPDLNLPPITPDVVFPFLIMIRR